MPSYSRCFLAIWLLLPLLFSACGDSPAKKLEVADRLLGERPDSAYLLLRDIDYSDFDVDSLRAKYIVTKARANLGVGRSLITDTLLPDAAAYYLATGDTLNWVIASHMVAAYDFYKGDGQEALAQVEGMIPKIKDSGLLWDTHIRGMEMSWGIRDYDATERHADWLLTHTSLPADRLRYATMKMAARYMAGRVDEAVTLGDSIRDSGLLPQKYSYHWASFMNDYAEMLDGVGRAREAVAVMEELMANCPPPFEEERASRHLSMAQFEANAGDLDMAQRHLDSIPEEIAVRNVELNASKAMLEGAIAFRKTGHFPAGVMHGVAKALDLNHRLTRYDRETAMESVMQLNNDKNELQLQKQRLWLAIFGIALLVVVLAGGTYLILGKRKQRMVEAEERAEALEHMLREVEQSQADKAVSSDNTRLKMALFRQLDILKSFAGVPTQQSRDALRKISNAGRGDATIDTLVDWPGFYSMIDELYDDFYCKITDTYPGLFNEKETQIILLIKAGFSTKEIGVLTEQSSATIYVRKTAIRKKLHTPENGDFIAQLDSGFSTSGSH